MGGILFFSHTAHTMHSSIQRVGEDTPWKTNMSPENQWLEDVPPIEIVLVFGGVNPFDKFAHGFLSPPKKHRVDINLHP